MTRLSRPSAIVRRRGVQIATAVGVLSLTSVGVADAATIAAPDETNIGWILAELVDALFDLPLLNELAEALGID